MKSVWKPVFVCKVFFHQRYVVHVEPHVLSSIPEAIWRNEKQQIEIERKIWQVRGERKREGGKKREREREKKKKQLEYRSAWFSRGREFPWVFDSEFRDVVL